MSTIRSVFRAVGSLWFAAVLLVLWLVAMACATVVESSQGTPQALGQFYTSWWFQTLLALLCANVLAALLLRYPFTRWHIGFALTHIGILVTFAGAVVTREWGIDGQLGLAEGQTRERLNLPAESTLTLVNRQDQTRASVDLAGRAFGDLEAVDDPGAPLLALGDIRAEVLRYLPDGERTLEVTNDNPTPRVAVQVSLSATGHEDPVWLFAGRPTNLGPVQAVLRLAGSEQELANLIAAPADGSSESKGSVVVEYQGARFEFPLERGLSETVPLGDSGYTAHVLRYLPHAVVEEDGLVNASPRPVNPAIEAVIVGPEGTEKRLAFARFPDFQSMHGEPLIEGIKLTFTASRPDASELPIEVICAPEGATYVRFRRGDDPVVVASLTVGSPVEAPWPMQKFAVLQRYERARVSYGVKPVERMRDARIPALLVKLSTAEHSNEVWVQKFTPLPLTVDGVGHELRYDVKSLSLGFSVKLNKFHIGHYPGTRQPRSFESHVTITDAGTGRELERVISMNNPTSYGGYTLFQSSYNVAGGQRISYLSVSWDPGKPIVFAGYITTIAGMIVVLITRMIERRRPGPQIDRMVRLRDEDARGPQIDVPQKSPQRGQERKTGALGETVGRKSS